MAQNNPPSQPRLHYGGVPAGYMLPNTVSLPYPLPPQVPVAVQRAPANFYPTSVQMSTQPPAATSTQGTRAIYSGPPPPVCAGNIPAGHQLVFRMQPQPPQNPAPGAATQSPPGGYPDAGAAARAQAQAAAQAAQARGSGIQYYFGGAPVRAPDPYAYGIITPQPAVRPVSPTDYGSGDPQGRRFYYARYQ